MGYYPRLNDKRLQEGTMPFGGFLSAFSEDLSSYFPPQCLENEAQALARNQVPRSVLPGLLPWQEAER
jgi:hypothetical protein